MSKTMSVKDAILARKATKAYLEEPAPSKEDLDLITDAGLWAPTASNIQNSVVLAVQDKDFKKEMANFFHDGNKLQVESSQVTFLFVGTPWTDDQKMGKMLKDHSISHWGIDDEKTVDNIVAGTVQYYTTISEFKDTVDIYSSAVQMAMMMLQATELGYDTNGMLGFDTKKLADFLVSKNLIEPGQRVNVAFSMGHRDENHERNKLAHNRVAKNEIIKVV